MKISRLYTFAQDCMLDGPIFQTCKELTKVACFTLYMIFTVIKQLKPLCAVHCLLLIIIHV